MTARTALFVPLLPLIAASPCGAERQRPQYEPQYHEVTLDYETPHTKWAKPYAGGPLRALFIGPRAVMREVVEVAQRLSVEYEEVIVHTRWQLGGDPSVGYQRIIGGLPDDVADRLREKLRQRYDVIVVGNIQWKILPEDIEYQILRQTRDGCGLVLAFVDQETDHLKRFLELARPEQGREMICSGVPFAGLDAWRTLGSPAEAAQKLTDPRRFGFGRVAVLKLGARSNWTLLTPQVGGTAADRPWLWDYYLSLPIRAMLWAAKREPVVRLAELQILRPDGTATLAPERADLSRSRLSVSWEAVGDLKDPRIAVRLRGPDGEAVIRAERPVVVTDGRASLDLALTPLPQSGHVADAWLKDGEEILDWASLFFEVTGPHAIKTVTTENDSINAEPCPVRVALARPAGEGLSLRLTGFDPYGRMVAETLTPLAAGQVEASPVLPTSHLIANALRIRASLMSGGQELDRAWVWQPVARPYPHDDFSFLIWAGPGDEFIPYYVGKVLADAGADTINHGGGLALARHGLRGTPGIRAGLHFNECKVTDHVRSPCFNDPAHRAKVRERLIAVARDHVRFGATAYTLGDDNNLAPTDVCFSEFCKADFRRYLKGTYRSLEALNAEWDTEYASWDEVMPAVLDDARREGHIAQWADHRMHMESVWADFHRFARDTVQEVDKTARVGSDAACGRGSYGGYDWWKLSRVLGLWNVYPDPIQVEALRSFHQPNAYTGIWYGGYLGQRYEAYERWAPWYSIFHQLSAAWWFQSFPSANERCQELAISSDLTPFGPFVITSEEVNEIKRGIGKLLLAAQRSHDGVAMLYSQASVHASTIDSSFGTAEASRRAWVELLEDVGLQYDLVASAAVEQGALTANGYRVLVLPACFALSEKEIVAIEAFARAGGNVVADVRPGWRDGHCKPTDTAKRRQLFGVSYDLDAGRGQPLTVSGEMSLAGRAIAYSLENVAPDTGAKLEADTQAQQPREGPAAGPCLVTRKCGNGRVILLNFSIEGYQKAKPETAWLREFVGPMMRVLGARPQAEVAAEAGEPFDVEQVSFADGPARYLGLTRWQWANSPTQTFSVTFGQKRHVYDARRGEYLGERESFHVPLGQGRSALFSLLPYRVTACDLVFAGPAQRGQLLRGRVGLEATAPRARHVVHIEVMGPDGKRLRHYAQNVFVPAGDPGTADIVIPLALNDVAGTWQIVARDVATGVSATASVEVE